MKKVFYSIAAAAILLGTTACGGDKKGTANDASQIEMAMESAMQQDDEAEYAQDATIDDTASISDDIDEPADNIDDATDDTDDSDANNSAGMAFTDSELSKFISDGKSGDIDRMIDALEWHNSVKAKLKPQVRALDENAIKEAIKLDKASEEIGEKYDRYSLSGALDSKTGEMSNSQLSRYNTACANGVLYFTSKDDTTEYNSLYRKLRYGSPF